MKIDSAIAAVQKHVTAHPIDRAWGEGWCESARATSAPVVTFKYAGATQYNGDLRIEQDETGAGYGRLIRFMGSTGIVFEAYELNLAIEVSDPRDFRSDVRIANVERVLIAILGCAALNSAAGGPRADFVREPEIVRLRNLALA